MAKRGECGQCTLEGMIRGDQAIARHVFRDARKRRLVPRLQQDGWPIFDLAGKRCAFPADLDAEMRKARRRGQSAATETEMRNAAPG